MTLRKIVFSFLLLFSFLPFAFAEGPDGLPEFTRNDRVLVLAPHPDDEAIGACAVIQRCVREGIPVKVVYFTNGDNNELSFIVYEKRIVFKKRAFVHMGEVRRSEALRAMKYLGLEDKDVIFLGYPDFGTLQIFSKFWDPKKPYRSMLTRVTRVPYTNSFSYDAPYIGQSILKDLGNIIGSFVPTKIFVSHPADHNRDHRALYLFLQVALWDMKGKLQPEVFPYLVHYPRWPMPRGFRPSLELKPPSGLVFPDIKWFDLRLDEEEIWIKRRAISYYRSQIAYAPSYLYSFARGNELFSDMPPVILSRKENGWREVRMEQETPAPAEKECKLSYALDGEDLLVRLTLRSRFKKNFGIFVYLFGYSGNKDFSLMPKIEISLGLRGISAWDKSSKIRTKDIKASFEGKCLILRVPLKLLGDPDRLLARTKTSTKDLPYDNTAWHVIYIRNE